MDFNDRFRDIKFRMKEKERLEGLKMKVERRQRELGGSKEGLQVILQREERDVEKLKGMSLAHFVHLIKGDMWDTLHKEQQEVISAKIKYDGVCSELELLEGEQRDILRQITSLGDLDEEYNKLMREKEEYLKEGTSFVAKELEAIINRKSDLKGKLRELEEAKRAGQKLLEALEGVLESLDSAKSWGTYDVLGGGLLATAAKHSRIDEAKEDIDRAQTLLRRFQRELQDLGEHLDINIEIGDFLGFADYFFDGFFTDWAVQNKINDARERVGDTLYRVNELLSGIDEEIGLANRDYEQLEGRRIDIIEGA